MAYEVQLGKEGKKERGGGRTKVQKLFFPFRKRAKRCRQKNLKTSINSGKKFHNNHKERLNFDDTLDRLFVVF